MLVSNGECCGRDRLVYAAQQRANIMNQFLRREWLCQHRKPIQMVGSAMKGISASDSGQALFATLFCLIMR